VQADRGFESHPLRHFEANINEKALEWLFQFLELLCFCLQIIHKTNTIECKKLDLMLPLDNDPDVCSMLVVFMLVRMLKRNTYHAKL
jgi:hypothetical protein